MREFVADFETTTNEKDCRVWAFGICDIDNLDNVIIGTSLDDFMKWCMNQPDNPKVHFVNLKFDSQFILYWLFHNGFTHVSNEDRASNTFTTIINNKGLFYSIEVIFYLKGKRVKKVTFCDLTKLIPLSVEKIAKAFKLPISKGKIDYAAHDNLPPGSPISEKEKEYITNDVRIPAYALAYFRSQGLERMTIGSCALYEYKQIVGKKNFQRWFPTPKYFDDIKPCYKGGYVYLNPKFAGKKVGAGIVLDKNSMFPWVMRTKLLPWGTPIFYRGQYKQDDMYPLYIQMLRCSFELKPGKLPTVQIKHSLHYSGTEYLTTSNDEEIILVMTSVDLELFFEHYEVTNPEFLSGWKFRGAAEVLFNDYVDKWNAKKVEAREQNNPGLSYVAKNYLNHLYGKFGTSNKAQSKIPYLGEDDAIHYHDTKPEPKDGIYLPVAAFITAWARFEMVSAAQKIMDDYNSGKSKIQFLYCDTDSLHCYSEDFSLPEGLDIDQFRLGAWKFESKFRKAKYLRCKCYIEDSTEDIDLIEPDEWKLKVTVSGMPEDCRSQVNFNNFKIGAVYTGKKQPRAVKGGVILEDIDFTIKKV